MGREKLHFRLYSEAQGTPDAPREREREGRGERKRSRITIKEKKVDPFSYHAPLKPPIHFCRLSVLLR